MGSEIIETVEKEFEHQHVVNYDVVAENYDLVGMLEDAIARGFTPQKFRQSFRAGTNAHLKLAIPDKDEPARITSELKGDELIYRLYVPVDPSSNSE